jgi:ADP-heptose:LPS heptosyltransferase
MTRDRLVIVNFTRMGDLIQSGPLLAALKRAQPEACLTLVVFNRFSEVARRLPMVDEVIGFDVDHWVPLLDARRGDLPKAYRELEAFLADAQLRDVAAVHNLSHTPLSATLCGLMNASEGFGMLRDRDGHREVRGDWYNYLFSVMQDRSANPFNLVEIYQRLLKATEVVSELEFRVREEDRRNASQLLIQAGVDSGRPYVALQPGASNASRQWPAEAFAQLAMNLARHHVQSVVVGSTEESDLAREVVQRSGAIAVSAAGQTTVGSLAAVLESASRLISNDTGTIHVAASVGTPSIGIYLGPASAKDTAPYGSGHVIVEADLHCAPCSYHDLCSKPVCRTAVSAAAIAELVMADGRDLPGIAARLSGVRITRTRVHRNGRFELEPLNQAAMRSCDSRLVSYRRFWDNLLGWSASMNERNDVNTVLEEHDVGALALICDKAVDASRNLVMEAGSPQGTADRVKVLLQVQLDWQNDLRAFLIQHPEASPFPRFILTCIANARVHALNAYIDDLSRAVELFRRGMRLLINRTSQLTMTGSAHV